MLRFVCLIILTYSSGSITERPPRNPNYRWTVLPEVENRDICNDNKCGNVSHTMCRRKDLISSDCENFSMLPMEFRNRQKFVLMHNGLRNRIVRTKNSFVKDMNYLHWDKDLATMAEKWVLQCRILGRDPCDFIYAKFITVGQNHVFIKGTPGDDWEMKAMSEWFIQIQDLEPHDYESITKERANNFTQMMWARSQFIGCAGARMFDGFYVTCLYHPKGNRIGKSVYKTGTSEKDVCTECTESRSSCSRILTGLCGLDDEYILVSTATKQIPHLMFTFLPYLIRHIFVK